MMAAHMADEAQQWARLGRQLLRIETKVDKLLQRKLEDRQLVGLTRKLKRGTDKLRNAIRENKAATKPKGKKHHAQSNT
jgi:hypothetical protein